MPVIVLFLVIAVGCEGAPDNDTPVAAEPSQANESSEAPIEESAADTLEIDLRLLIAEMDEVGDTWSRVDDLDEKGKLELARRLIVGRADRELWQKGDFLEGDRLPPRTPPRAIGRLRVLSIVPDLLAAQTSDLAELRKFARLSLKHLGVPASLEADVDELPSLTGEARRARVAKLRELTGANIGDDAAAWKKLRDTKPNHLVRMWVARAGEAREAIAGLYSDQPKTRKNCERKLATLGPFGTREVLAELELHEDWLHRLINCSKESVRGLRAMAEILRDAGARGNDDAITRLWSWEDVFLAYSCTDLPAGERDVPAEQALVAYVDEALDELLLWPENLTERDLRKHGKAKPDLESSELRWYLAHHCYGHPLNIPMCNSGSFVFGAEGERLAMRQVTHDDSWILKRPSVWGWANEKASVGFVYQEGSYPGDMARNMVFYSLGENHRPLCRLDDGYGENEILEKYRRWVMFNRKGCKQTRPIEAYLLAVTVYDREGRFMRVAAGDVVIIRKGPAGDAGGQLAADARCVWYTGERTRRDGQSWYRVEHQGQNGWVNSSELKPMPGKQCRQQ